MATRSTTDIKRRSYQVLARTAAAGAEDVPADASAFATFLATFTSLGFSERDTLELPIEVGDTVILDDGQRKVLGYNLDGTVILLQTSGADATEFEALNNTSQDVMFHAPNASPPKVHVLPAITTDVFARIGGSDADAYDMGLVKENAEDVASIIVSYDEPL